MPLSRRVVSSALGGLTPVSFSFLSSTIPTYAALRQQQQRQQRTARWRSVYRARAHYHGNSVALAEELRCALAASNGVARRYGNKPTLWIVGGVMCVKSSTAWQLGSLCGEITGVINVAAWRNGALNVAWRSAYILAPVLLKA